MNKLITKIKNWYKKKIKNNNDLFVSMIAFICFVLAIMFVVYSYGNRSSQIVEDNIKLDIQELTYPDYLEKLENKEIKEVILNPEDPVFFYRDLENQIYSSPNPKTDKFREDLLMSKVKIIEEKPVVKSPYYEEVPPQEQSTGIVYFRLIFNMIMLVGVVFLLKTILSSGGLAGVDKVGSTSKVDVGKGKRVRLKDVEGLDEVKEDIALIIRALKNPLEFEKAGAKAPKGVMLYGPPGTGKTLTAKAIAGEAGVPFYSISGSDFVEKYVGVGAKRVRDLFEDARSNAPCIIFIDEIDAVGKERGSSNNSEIDQTINALLTELDGFDGSEGVVTIAATNRLDSLDKALIRPGRFDKHLAIPLPDKEGRRAILNIYKEGKTFADDVDFESIIEMTTDFSGAGIESLLNEAALLSMDNEGYVITNKELNEAFYKVVVKGNIKSGQGLRSKEELELVAWHEAGHALLTKLLTNDKVSKVTILATTSGAGGVTFTTPEETNLYSKEYIENKIAIMYGGRIAEYLLLGSEEKITTGASNDIQQATRLIKGYINHYGMSEKFGMINVDELFGSQSSQLGANEELLKEAQEVSERIYTKALKILEEEKETLEKIAKALLEKETLTNEELDNIINN